MKTWARFQTIGDEMYEAFSDPNIKNVRDVFTAATPFGTDSQSNKDKDNAKITEISRLSRPGRRWYVGADKIPQIKRGRGMVIVSTSQGLMTGDQAKKQRIGGELICKVY